MRPARRLLLCALPLLAAAPAFAAGDEVCAECHRDVTTRFRNTAMAGALSPIASCEILKRKPDLIFKESEYESRIVRDGDRDVLTVKSSGETLTAPLLWAFGRGEAGQTYVYQLNGIYYESRVSFFNALHGLDLTMGAQTRARNIEDAAGRRLGERDAVDCFAATRRALLRGPAASGIDLAGRAASCHGPTRSM